MAEEAVALDVFIYDLAVSRQLDALVPLRGAAPAHLPPSPYAVAFQFLDYPLILVYPKPQPMPALGEYLFESGKSCTLQANTAELSFLLDKVNVL